MSFVVECLAAQYSTGSVSLPLAQAVNLTPQLSFTLTQPTLVQVIGQVFGLDLAAQNVWLVIDGDANNPYVPSLSGDHIVYMATLSSGDHTIDYQGFAFNLPGTATYAAVSALNLTG